MYGLTVLCDIMNVVFCLLCGVCRLSQHGGGIELHSEMSTGCVWFNHTLEPATLSPVMEGEPTTMIVFVLFAHIDICCGGFDQCRLHQHWRWGTVSLQSQASSRHAQPPYWRKSYNQVTLARMQRSLRCWCGID